jgi:hypothetical protein
MSAIVSAACSQRTSRGVRDVVGQVGDDAARRRAKRGRIDGQRIGLDDLQPALCRGLELGQSVERPRIDLDRHDAGRPFEQQGAGEATRPGADLDGRALIERRGRAGDAAGQVEVEQEMLAEAFAGVEAMAGNRLAQRRQGRYVHRQVPRRRAMSSAIAKAAIRLAGSARPVPAMSSAVPWSGEVRTKGRPSVTLTPPEKSMVLIGISAWS